MRPADQRGLHLSEAVEPHKGWRACWGRLHCFASSRKRGRSAPQLLSAPSAPTHNNNGNLSPSDPARPPSSCSLSPLVHAPPSSPASFRSLDPLPSPNALITLFPLKSTENCGTDSSTPRANSAFHGFGLDPVLVTPPLHSTFTTEPTTPLSTAPFTPPPELAHLTGPPSPEVPFAKFVTSFANSQSVLQEPDVAVPLNLELRYQLYPGSTDDLGSPRSRTPISEDASPQPERFPFMEDDSIAASLLQAPTPIGFDQAIPIDACTHSSSEIVYQYRPHLQKNQHVQTEDGSLEVQLDADQNLQTHNLSHGKQLVDAECSYPCPEEACKELNQSGQSDMAGSKFYVDDVWHERMYPGLESISSTDHLNVNGAQADEQNSCSLIPQVNKVEKSNAKKNIGRTEDDRTCFTCDVLTSKCRALSDALHDTEEKLCITEKKEHANHDREKNYKQLIQWLQLEAKSQQASICRLSEELSWQESALLDLQAQRLAELGIDMSGVCKEVFK